MRNILKKATIMMATAALFSTTLLAPVQGAEKIKSEEETVEVTTVQKLKKVQKVKVSKAVCTSSGKINVNFKRKVAYGAEVTATITDAEGNVTEATISKTTTSKCVVKATNLVKGNQYTVTIKNVKLKNAQEFGEVSATFKAKKLKTEAKVKNVIKSGKMITIKFNSKVEYSTPEVKVTDNDGKEYQAKVVKITAKSAKVKVIGLKKGKQYTVALNGVKEKKEANYASVTASYKFGKIK